MVRTVDRTRIYERRRRNKARELAPFPSIALPFPACRDGRKTIELLASPAALDVLAEVARRDEEAAQARRGNIAGIDPYGSQSEDIMLLIRGINNTVKKISRNVELGTKALWTYLHALERADRIVPVRTKSLRGERHVKWLLTPAEKARS